MLRQLLLRLDVDGAVTVGSHEPPTWPPGAHDRLVAAGLLARGTNATGLVCDECETACWVVPDRITRPDGEQVLFSGCVGGRAEVGLLTFPLDRLVIWRFDVAGFARALASAGTLRGPVVEVVPGRLWRLGTLGAGRNRRPVLLAPGLARLRAEERRGLLDQVGTGLPVVLVPCEIPTDVPSERATIVPLAEVLDLEPDGLFLDLEAVAAAAAPAKRDMKPVEVPAGTAWESIVVRVVDDEHVQVVVGWRTEVRSFRELGMVDARRREPTPNATWAFLQALARAGSMTWM